MEHSHYILGYMICYINKLNKLHQLLQEELQKFNYKVGDTEGIVNIPLQIENVNKSVLVREDKTQIKLSFRSQGDVPVNTMAEKFGGGGHKNAAGGESNQSMEETLDKLRRTLRGF